MLTSEKLIPVCAGGTSSHSLSIVSKYTPAFCVICTDFWSKPERTGNFSPFFRLFCPVFSPDFSVPPPGRLPQNPRCAPPAAGRAQELPPLFPPGNSAPLAGRGEAGPPGAVGAGVGPKGFWGGARRKPAGKRRLGQLRLPPCSVSKKQYGGSGLSSGIRRTVFYGIVPAQWAKRAKARMTSKMPMPKTEPTSRAALMVPRMSQRRSSPETEREIHDGPSVVFLFEALSVPAHSAFSLPPSSAFICSMVSSARASCSALL